MTAKRFSLVHLTFAGGAVPPASVAFADRATVVRGPSDTGKSFIVAAIDFMLGGGTPPSEIPQSAGYTLVLLGIRTQDDRIYTLARQISGGDFDLYEGDRRGMPVGPPRERLKAKHKTGSTDTVSYFLLSLIALTDQKIRRNADNATSAFTFRNMAHLCVIDETSMQAERAPVYSDVTTNRTSDVSALKLILEGQDDSHLVAVPNARERKQVSSARDGVLDRLIDELEKELEGVDDLTQLRDQIQRVELSLESATQSVDGTSTESRILASRIAATEREVLSLESRLVEIDELRSRFELLERQYESDAARLEMIAEAGSLLGFFRPGTCAFCGAEAEHQHLNETVAVNSTAFKESVEAEQTKTALLTVGLESTLQDLSVERDATARRVRAFEDAIASARITLTELDSRLQPVQRELRQYITARSYLEKQVGLYQQIDKLETLRRQLQDETRKETATTAELMRLSSVAGLSGEIATRLGAWGFPDGDRARYDRSEQDVVTGDQLRAAHGKGVRAILHAAFTLGLAQYCATEARPHPGFVVLDSPLVTYRPPERGGDPTENVPATFVDDFYNDIESNVDCQVIIFENIAPATGPSDGWRDVSFSKNSGLGRYGFFPPKP